MSELSVINARRPAAFAAVSDEEWSDWRWQHAHRLRTAEALSAVIRLRDDERQACERATERFPLAVTPYYASLMRPDDPGCPIRLQAIPRLAELERHPSDLADPLAEDEHRVAGALTHRYPDRAMLYTTHSCAVYCRHCNRRRKVGDPTSAPSKDDLRAAVAYLRQHPEVRDVLVSGGDPLSLSDERLDELLGSLRAIPHLEIIRVATRAVVTLPQRVTRDLVGVLRRHQPIYVATHFNHLAECSSEAAAALYALADGGAVIVNQMVLLKGINDDPAMVGRMNQWLLKNRCRPYYIFQCDPAVGISHFRTPIAAGLEIIEALRGFTSGLAVPHYVVDLPGGGGKVSLQPEYLLRREGKRLTFRNYLGKTFVYDEV
ncbi:MAG: KamA family radical SAM protein [Deltaproteobacteria bacterium]|nr:KamA family radical SAM protein [Deltaproteobacteria bacterium]